MEINITTINLDPNSGGGGKIELQEKVVTVSSNGVQTVVPDDGYALSSVQVNAAITGDTSALDFSIIGYDEDFSAEINAKYNADINHSQSLYKANSGPLITAASLFSNDTELVYAPYVNLKTVLNVTSMFQSCSELEIVPKYDISNTCITYQNMFYKCSNLKTIDCTGWDLSKAKSIIRLFSTCTKLETIDCTGWDLSDYSYTVDSLFAYCYNLKTITGIEDWQLPKATSLYYMFNTCKSLESLDLSKWGCQSLTGLTNTFSDCSSLTSLNLSGWNTSQVTKMDNTFMYCTGLTSLNLSGWDMSSVTYFGSAWYRLDSLTDLVFGTGLKTSISITHSENLTVESILSIFNGLYDFTANGETTSCKLTLGSTNLAKMTDEQKAIATNKGWTLA